MPSMPNETDEDVARMAPAAICSVAGRIIRLRSFLKQSMEDGVLTEAQCRMFDQFTQPFAFEAEILSSNSPRLWKAIKQLGLLVKD